MDSSPFIVITGASAGIGKACAEAFGKSNYRLILGARRTSLLEEQKENLLKLGAPSVDCLALDVSNNESTAKFCTQVLELTSGSIGALINNAGLAIGVDHISKGDLTVWETVINTNITGVLRVTRGLLPAMIESQSGHLFFLSSIAAHQVYEGGGVYCATKHAVKALAKTLKLELNGTGMRVTTIDPGMVETEFSVTRFRGDKSKADSTYTGMTPLTGKDIAECVLFAFERPAHLNIDEMILMPTDQATVYKVSRKS